MDNLKHIEVELKFPLRNHKELIEKLKSIAKLEKQGDFQKDTYFNPAHRDFLSKKPVSEWLRLRESKKGFSLNYKKWHNEDGNKTVSCDEFETKIENLDALKKLFENLNFKELISVEKNRSIWNFKDTEIAIDEVKGLGNFIEIEARGNFTNIEEAKKHLYKILEELGAEVGEPVEYPTKIPEDGIGNTDFNQGLKVSKFAFPILHLDELVEAIPLRTLKDRFGFNPPQGYIYTDTFPELVKYVKNCEMRRLY